jgi:hypothetical protein
VYRMADVVTKGQGTSSRAGRTHIHTMYRKIAWTSMDDPTLPQAQGDCMGVVDKL